MKKSFFVLIGIVIFVVFAILFILLRVDEDSWIKNEKGIWVQHGNPGKVPDYVVEQQELLSGVSQLYMEKKQELEQKEINISSQCFGVVHEYAVDIVHVPRTEEDNLPENQCDDYRNGIVSHFVELDKDGNIVRVV